MNRHIAAALFAGVFLAPSAPGALVQYTLDAEASLFTVTATLAGVVLEPQTPGSATTGFTGSFIGDLGNGALTLQTSAPTSQVQSTPQLPGQFAGDPTSSFGFKGLSPTMGGIFASIGQISFYISSDFRPPLSVEDGTFGPTDFGFFLSGGTYTFSTDTVSRGFHDLHGYGAPNQATRMGTLTTTGGVETLTIPIDTTIAITSLSEGDTILAFSGQFVAHRAVPEPSVALLMAFGSAVPLGSRRRQKRHGMNRE